MRESLVSGDTVKSMLGLAGGLLLCLSFSTTKGAVIPPREFGLRAISSQFWTLIPKDAKLEVVAKGFGFTEGPVWDPAGFLYVSDEEQNKIYKVLLNGQKEELISLGDPDGSTFDQNHTLIDCASVLRAIIRIGSDGKY